MKNPFRYFNSSPEVIRLALKFLKRTMKRYGRPRAIVTDRLRSYDVAMKVIGNAAAQERGRWLNNQVENAHLPFTPQSTTTSIRTATSTAEISSSRTALTLWLSGVRLRPNKPSPPALRRLVRIRLNTLNLVQQYDSD